MDINMPKAEILNSWLDDKGWVYVLLFVAGFALGYIL